MNDLIENLRRINEFLVDPGKLDVAGFIWNDGKVSFIPYDVEHRDALEEFPDKIGTNYIDFSIYGTRIQMRVDHQLKPYEIRLINTWIKERNLYYMVVDIWENREGDDSKWLELNPIPTSWASRINDVWKSFHGK